jgi:tetratricopeptide (TPR) repeat protein
LRGERGEIHARHFSSGVFDLFRAPRRSIGLTVLVSGLALTITACRPNSKAPSVDTPNSDAHSVDAPSVDTAPVQPPAAAPAAAAVPDPAAAAAEVDPAKLQQAGLVALQAGDVDAASKLARAAILAAPDDPQSIFLMARAFAARNRYSEAIKLLDDMADRVPSSRLPVLGQTAEWLVLQGQYREAEQRYRTLLELAPGASIVERSLARLLNRQGRRLEAAALLRQLCRRGDIEEVDLRSLLLVFHPFADDASTERLAPIGTLGHARREISEGNWNDAAAQLEQPATRKSPAAESLLGRIHAQQQDFPSLDRWASTAARSSKQTVDHWYAMGVFAAVNNDHEAAVRCFCEAVIRDQTDQSAYAMLSQSLAKIGADDEAKQAADRAALLQRTQQIGGQMAKDDARDLQALAQLVDLLDQLQRPYEALAWRAVRVAYAGMNPAETKQALAEINRERLARLASSEPETKDRFVLCGVDIAALRADLRQPQTTKRNE